MVLVFGSINVDLVAQVTHIPAPGATLAGHSLATVPGGKGANQALAEGVAAGSLACTGRGAQAALPDRSAIAVLAATL